MAASTRYAIYHVPAADDAYYRFGAEMIGYDAFTAKDVAYSPQATSGFGDWADLTADPRKYGFHATLKAPFLLADGATEPSLCKAFDQFVATPREVPIITPVVRAIGSFIAVVPDTAAAPLAQLADACVTAFEGYRAPLTAYDRERRLKSPLTPHQIEYLDRWGYPYVFEEFRFHMTLTGSLPPEKRATVLPFLQGAFAKLGLASLPIAHIALLKQENGARFVVLRHAALKAL